MAVPVYARVQQKSLLLKMKVKPPAEVVLLNDAEAVTPASCGGIQRTCSMLVTLITCLTECSTPVICCSSVGSYSLLLWLMFLQKIGQESSVITVRGFYPMRLLFLFLSAMMEV